MVDQVNLANSHYVGSKQAVVSLRVLMAKPSMLTQQRIHNRRANNSIYSKSYDRAANREYSLDWENSKAALLMKINRLTEDNKRLKLKNAIMANRVKVLEEQITSISVVYHLSEIKAEWLFKSSRG